MGIRSTAIAFLLILIGLDAAVVAAFGPGPHGAGPVMAAPGTTGGHPGAAPARMDPGWALCLTRFEEKSVTPTSVAITYLDADLDDDVVPGDVRSWFAEVDGMMVDVYKLELQNGRRRIALELSSGKWPAWQQVAAGHTGKDVCSLVRAALVDAGVGRPADSAGSQETSRRPGRETGMGPGQEMAQDSAGEAASLERSRHDFEFIYARRPRLYRTIEWVGTLDHALELDTFVELRRWLNREAM